MEREVVIGLEVHVELKTKSKIFCSCSTEFGDSPNTNTCPICLGMPGVLPVLNKQVVEYAMRAGLALNCEIQNYSKFDRKNYFYPDLPKGYQISQYDYPIARNGYIEINIDGQPKKIRINRIHMEEDAGKLIHEEGAAASLVDYNRTGVPLIEIVSEADIRSPEEAREYLTKLKSILEYVGVSDCKMEEGSLRCDANVSLRPKGATYFGTKTELKNMNSFKSVQRGLEYEVLRQNKVLDEGGQITQETRRWDETKGITVPMRSKEEAHDYRYFPEPDLVSVIIDEAWLERTKKEMPELPDVKQRRFIDEFGLPEYDAKVITASKALSEFFEECVRLYNDPKTVSNWVMGDLMKNLNNSKISISECKITPQHLAGMLQLLERGVISGTIAKTVFDEMFATGKTAEKIVEEKNLVQITDTAELEKMIDEVLANNPKSVKDFKNGKEKALGFLVGQVMRQTKGKANPEIVNKILREKLQ